MGNKHCKTKHSKRTKDICLEIPAQILKKLNSAPRKGLRRQNVPSDEKILALKLYWCKKIQKEVSEVLGVNLSMAKRWWWRYKEDMEFINEENTHLTAPLRKKLDKCRNKINGNSKWRPWMAAVLREYAYNKPHTDIAKILGVCVNTITSWCDEKSDEIGEFKWAAHKPKRITDREV